MPQKNKVVISHTSYKPYSHLLVKDFQILFQRFRSVFMQMYTAGISRGYIDGLMQGCNISIANALETLQSCTKPSI